MPSAGLSTDGAKPLPHIDTVILSFERLSETLKAIDSALEQTDVRGQVIVIDQGSAADTVEALLERARGEARLTVDLQPVNLGPPGGRRRAMEISVAPFVACLDNDAVFDGSDVLSRAVAMLETRADLGAVGLLVRLASGGGIDALSWPHRLDWMDRMNEVLETVQFAEGAVVLRRSAYDSTPGWRSELFFYWEGLDLAYGLHSAGWGVVHAGPLAIRHNVSPERRVHWDGGRFYYYVRNRVAIEWDYFGVFKAAQFAVWYLALGVSRRHLQDAARGLRDVRLVVGDRGARRMSTSAKTRVRRLQPDRREAFRIARSKLRRSHHG